MDPEWIGVIAPATGLVGVVVGAGMNQRFAARTSRDNWRRDALLKLHNDIAACISGARFNDKDLDLLMKFGSEIYALETRAVVLNSQCAPILDEILDDVHHASDAFRDDPGQAFENYIPQLAMSQKMLLQVMQDELDQKRINTKKNAKRTLAIKQKFMDGKL